MDQLSPPSVFGWSLRYADSANILREEAAEVDDGDSDGRGRWPTRRASGETAGEDEGDEWTALLTLTVRQESIIRVQSGGLPCSCLLRQLA